MIGGLVGSGDGGSQQGVFVGGDAGLVVDKVWLAGREGRRKTL